MKTFPQITVVALTLLAAPDCLPADVACRISRDSILSTEGIVLTGSDRLSTPGVFQPPVDIVILARTDSTNLRMGYAADQVIFNWELNQDELRVDGGPASGKHKPGAGRIPAKAFVTIHWVVTKSKQSIYVDNELRYEHEGDYSKIKSCVSVWPAEGSGATVTVKAIKVRAGVAGK
ncbi:MAG TPA: hypothetical protein VLT36_21665 [Candidatus Dormibacteraeota bacterium]|nr:hypothetical protein [Candidatus Dormibacteraeota bacterium]